MASAPAPDPVNEPPPSEDVDPEPAKQEDVPCLDDLEHGMRAAVTRLREKIERMAKHHDGDPLWHREGYWQGVVGELRAILDLVAGYTKAPPQEAARVAAAAEDEEEAPAKRRRAAKTHTMTVAEVLSALSETTAALAGEMEEWRDNIEEKFSNTQKYQDVESAAESIREMADNSAPSDLLARLPEDVQQLTITVAPLRARAGRAVRLGSACADVAIACELLREQYKDAAWLAQVGDVEELLNEADAIEFPGMY